MKFPTSFTKRFSLGIELSDTGVKMLALVRERKQVRVAAFSRTSFPQNAHCDGRITDTKVCADVIGTAYTAINKTIAHHMVPITVGLSDAQVQMTTITLPSALADTAHVYEEATKNIPIDPTTMRIDWQIVGNTGDTARIFVITVPHAVGDAVATTCAQIHCFPTVIESESIALARLFSAETPQVIIDFGASRTLFAVVHEGVPLVSISLPLHGIMLTDAIAATLQLSPKEAEETKIRCGFDDTVCKGALREIVRTHLDSTIQKIRTALEQVSPTLPAPPKEIIIVGGGAHLKKIDTILTEALGIPVREGNLWQKVAQPKDIPAPTLAWATPLGLALRGFV